MESGEPLYTGEYLPVTMLLAGGSSTWCGGWETLTKFEYDSRPTAVLLVSKDASPATDASLTLDQIPIPTTLKRGKVARLEWKGRTLGAVVYIHIGDNDQFDLAYAAVYSYAVANHQLNGYNMKEEAKTVNFKDPENLTEVIEALGRK